MTTIEMKECLRHWIETYVDDDVEKTRLRRFLDCEDVPVKGILAAITPHFNEKFSEADRRMLQDIVYYYL